jgi:hypothetical protein
MPPVPLINPFIKPYEVWSQRDATHEEMMEAIRRTGRAPSFRVNDQLLQTITTPLQAAKYMANEGSDRGLECHIEDELDNGGGYASWRRAMPSATPSSISTYQKSYPHYDANQVNNDINSIGVTLPPGQQLFHGGLWPGGDSFTTDHPLSTTFCPQVAMRELEHKGKAYDAGRIDLFVLRATSPMINMFIFRNKGTNLGHEKEVLFAAGVNLTLQNCTLIRNDYKVCKVAHGAGLIYKEVPVYVFEIDIESK